MGEENCFRWGVRNSIRKKVRIGLGNQLRTQIQSS